MFIRNLEYLLENQIEGFFYKKFSSDLQLAELEKRLEKEIALKKKVRKGQPYIPNCYTFSMAESDYRKMCAQQTYNRLYVRLIATAIKKNYVIPGKIAIEIDRNASLKRGCLHIASAYKEEDPVNVQDIIKAPQADHTLVFERNILASAEMREDYKISSLKVLEGPDMDSLLDIGEKRIHIGRRECNEFSLKDRNTSRLHAYISFEQYRHCLYDAGSLNGTYVNGEKINCHTLNNGDQISLGNTVMLYEVM